MNIKEELNKIKHLIDEYGYGVLKEDIDKDFENIFYSLKKENIFTESNLGYITTLKGSSFLGKGTENSKKVLEYRKKGIKIWSFSELDQWKGCQLSYKLQRIDRIQQEHSSYAMYGSLAHDIQEKYILGEIDYKNMLQEFKSRLSRMKALGVFLPKDSKGGTSIQEGYEKAVKDYFKHNYTDITNTKNYRVEVEVFESINNNYIIGFIDLLKIKRKVGEVFYCDIIDFKTSTMYSKKEMKERARQLLLYKYLIEKQYPNIKIENIGWDFMKYVNIVYNGKIYTKQRKDSYLEFFRDKLLKQEIELETVNKIVRSKTVPQELCGVLHLENCYVYYPYTEKDIEDVIDFVKEVIESVKLGLENKTFAPRDYEKESFFCNNLCGFKNHCPHLDKIGVNRGVKSSAEIMMDILNKVKMQMKQ